MVQQQYAHVSESIANAILDREQVHPLFLHRNPDHSFTATFDDKPTPLIEQSILKAHDAIILLTPEMVDGRQPNVEPNITATVRFAFTEAPEVDQT